jgi:hypothetical protein
MKLPALVCSSTAEWSRSNQLLCQAAPTYDDLGIDRRCFPPPSQVEQTPWGLQGHAGTTRHSWDRAMLLQPAVKPWTTSLLLIALKPRCTLKGIGGKRAEIPLVDAFSGRPYRRCTVVGDAVSAGHHSDYISRRARLRGRRRAKSRLPTGCSRDHPTWL